MDFATGDGEHEIALAQAGAIGRAIAGKTDDHNSGARRFRRKEPKPRTLRPIRAADASAANSRSATAPRSARIIFNNAISPSCELMRHLQRADAPQFARWADQGGATPIRMRRRGEDGVVEDIFPIAGELLSRDDMRGHRAAAPAGAGQDNTIARPRRLRVTERQCGAMQRLLRLNEAETRRVIIADDMARPRPCPCW